MQIAINGVDGVGKSQQIKLLRFYNNEALSFAKPLIEYSKKWPKLKGRDMFSWWFKKADISEFFDVVLESLNVRHREFENSVVILDRGTLMFKAVCAATISVRTGASVQDSMKNVDSLFSDHLDYDLGAEHNILLQPDLDYQASIASYLSLLQDGTEGFTDEENEVYSCYQKLLKEAIHYYFDSVTVSKITVDRPICEIQNELRKLVGNIATQSLPEICGGIKRIIGFGGLSECGKSSFAEHFRKNRGYCRLKLGYFVEILKRNGEKDTPENVAMEFLHFCKTHYYVEDFTLESLHEPYTPAFLKLLFGTKFKIVFLDVPFTIRCRRLSIEQGISFSQAEEATRNKDRVKMDRGAEIVGAIADINFDNSNNEHRKNILKLEMALVP